MIHFLKVTFWLIVIVMILVFIIAAGSWISGGI